MPVKISYSTKLEIFKEELKRTIEKFLLTYTDAVGLKLLKSFFYHRYCENSYKALFVQLENATRCKSFTGNVMIYQLKTKIQEEMKHSIKSPFLLDIESLLRLEGQKFKFYKQVEDLCIACESLYSL